MSTAAFAGLSGTAGPFFCPYNIPALSRGSTPWRVRPTLSPDGARPGNRPPHRRVAPTAASAMPRRGPTLCGVPNTGARCSRTAWTSGSWSSSVRLSRNGMQRCDGGHARPRAPAGRGGPAAPTGVSAAWQPPADPVVQQLFRAGGGCAPCGHPAVRREPEEGLQVPGPWCARCPCGCRCRSGADWLPNSQPPGRPITHCRRTPRCGSTAMPYACSHDTGCGGRPNATPTNS